MLEPTRKYSTSLAYRFGYNGKEQDSLLGGGVGIDYNYGARINDVRIGRFLSVDPLQKKFAFLTPYQFASNTPIWAKDLDGRESDYVNVTINLGKDGSIERSDAKVVKEAGFLKTASIHWVGGGLTIPVPVLTYTPEGPLGSGTLYTVAFSFHTKPPTPEGDALETVHFQYYVPASSSESKHGGFYLTSANGGNENHGGKIYPGEDSRPINIDGIINAAGASADMPGVEGFPDLVDLGKDLNNAVGKSKVLNTLLKFATAVDNINNSVDAKDKADELGKAVVGGENSDEGLSPNETYSVYHSGLNPDDPLNNGIKPQKGIAIMNVTTDENGNVKDTIKYHDDNSGQTDTVPVKP